MAIASYISLTYWVFILIVCQINLSSVDGLSQSKTHLNPAEQQDGQSNSFNEYPRQRYPVISKLHSDFSSLFIVF
jgi:hypothetical protein